MPRRDRDPRPSIEVIGGAPTEESVQDVAVGGDGRGRRRRGVVAAAIVVVVGVALAVGSGDDGEREAASTSTTRVRRTTTSTTSTTIGPIGPVLDEPTGAAILLGSEAAGWQLLDLDTGVFRTVPGRWLDVYGTVLPVRGGVVTSNGLSTTYLPLLSGGEPVELGPGGLVAASGRDDRVWIGDDPSERRLVDLAGRTLDERRFPVAASYYGESASGPVLSDGGRIFLLSADGPRPIGVGQPLGVSGDRIALRECGVDGQCSTVVVDLASGVRTVLSGLQSQIGTDPGFAVGFQFTPDGDYVSGAYDARGNAEIRWVDESGSLLAAGTVGVTPDGMGCCGELAFLPGRLGLVWPNSAGDLSLARPVGGELEIATIELGSSRRFDRVIVIRP